MRLGDRFSSATRNAGSGNVRAFGASVSGIPFREHGHNSSVTMNQCDRSPRRRSGENSTFIGRPVRGFSNAIANPHADSGPYSTTPSEFHPASRSTSAGRTRRPWPRWMPVPGKSSCSSSPSQWTNASSYPCRSACRLFTYTAAASSQSNSRRARFRPAEYTNVAA